MAGEALSKEEPPYDDQTLKPVLQNLLFSRPGRLALYFENEYARRRMEADAERYGRKWTIAAVDETGVVNVLDPARATPAREVRLGADAALASVPRWVDRR
jgi:hypothetical protein